MIAAVILSAGKSSRMGSPKALLPVNADEPETTFVSHLLAVFAASRAEPVLVIVGHQADTLRRAVDWGTARLVVNERYEDGMLSSIQAAVHALEGTEVEGMLVCPVDHPGVTPAIVDLLIENFETHGPAVVLPVHEGRRGHPVLFSRRVFGDLLRAPETVGARQVVWDYQEDLLEVTVADSGVNLDIDTPADYRAFKQKPD